MRVRKTFVMCQGKEDQKRGEGDAPPVDKGPEAMMTMMAEMQRTIAALQEQVNESKSGGNFKQR